MVSISIIGYGNVGRSLARAVLAAPGLKLVQVFCRSASNLPVSSGIQFVHTYEELVAADLYIICVKDDAIAEVSSSLPLKGALLAHTSGSMPLEVIDRKNRQSVFYPLQSFSAAKEVDWTQVPICLEAGVAEDEPLLLNVAEQLSDTVTFLNHSQRKKLHLAAVIVNNFVNHLYYRAEELCDANDIPFKLLYPIIMETAEKIREMPPKEAQTGPARRNDQKTLLSHRKQIEGTALEELYKVLTTSIRQSYE